jgi:hypothetical protein
MSKLQEKIDNLDDKYSVRILNGFHVLMCEDQYAGFVSEDVIIESDKLYPLLSQLVEHLENQLN